MGKVCQSVLARRSSELGRAHAVDNRGHTAPRQDCTEQIFGHARGLSRVGEMVKMVNRGVPNGVVLSVRHHAVVELQRELAAQRSAANGGVADPAAQSIRLKLDAGSEISACRTRACRTRQDVVGQGQVASCNAKCTIASLAAHAAACSQSRPADLITWQQANQGIDACSGQPLSVSGTVCTTRGDRSLQPDIVAG